MSITSVERLKRQDAEGGGIPPSFISVMVYIRFGQLEPPLSSVVEKFKLVKCRVVIMSRVQR